VHERQLRLDAQRVRAHADHGWNLRRRERVHHGRCVRRRGVHRHARQL
jgi:hypothetical protein